MKLFKRKPKIIKVTYLMPSRESVIFDVENLEFLKENFRRIFESPMAYYGNNEDGVFRFKKPNYKPKIVEAQAITLDPSNTAVYVNMKVLAEIAEKYDTEIYELEDCHLIIGPGINWFSIKDGEREFEMARKVFE